LSGGMGIKGGLHVQEFFGVGAEIAAAVTEHAFDYLDAPPIRVAQKDVPLPYAANLEKLSLPHAADIVAAAKKVCYRETE
jgi:pyruvate dehydrogenase E1 component beta subunit